MSGASDENIYYDAEAPAVQDDSPSFELEGIDYHYMPPPQSPLQYETSANIFLGNPQNISIPFVDAYEDEQYNALIYPAEPHYSESGPSFTPPTYRPEDVNLPPSHNEPMNPPMHRHSLPAPPHPSTPLPQPQRAATSNYSGYEWGALVDTTEYSAPTDGRVLPQSDLTLTQESVPSDNITTEAPWIIKQAMYPGTQRCGQSRDNVPAFTVNILAAHAHPDSGSGKLLEGLSNPCDAAFTIPERKEEKFTTRLAFDGLPPNSVKQYREYSSYPQRSKALELAHAQGIFKPQKARPSVPLTRAALVEKMAIVLKEFMSELKHKGMPLTFGGQEVEFNHVLIVDIYRPTTASIQPTLAIHEEFRHLYRVPRP
ncbi:hypothetical protein BC628DRAFT_931175 [Trametes gibbosa]|nr:hypothetical protein BC628DRAFT_931175 [Trametes gibbosa]